MGEEIRQYWILERWGAKDSANVQYKITPQFEGTENPLYYPNGKVNALVRYDCLNNKELASIKSLAYTHKGSEDDLISIIEKTLFGNKGSASMITKIP